MLSNNKYTAVIILQYGNSSATIDCLESLYRYNTAHIKLVVVDNASPHLEDVKSVVSYLGEKFGDNFLETTDGVKHNGKLPVATLVRSNVNDGYARGNNKGLVLAYSDPEVDTVLILNNDVLFVEDIIPKLREDLAIYRDCGLITPLLYKKGLKETDPNCARREGRVRDILVYNFLFFRTTPGMRRYAYIDVKPDSGIVRADLISGSCMMADKSLIKSIGGFDPGTFLYQEENILWEKIKKIGHGNYVDTDIKCVHLGGDTIGKNLSPGLLRLSFKSQLYFIKHYVPSFKYAKLILVWVSQQWALTIKWAIFILKRIIKSVLRKK